MTRRQRAAIVLLPCSIPHPENDNDSLEMIQAQLRIVEAEIAKLDAFKLEVEETFESVRKMILEG